MFIKLKPRWNMNENDFWKVKLNISYKLALAAGCETYGDYHNYIRTRTMKYYKFVCFRKKTLIASILAWTVLFCECKIYQYIKPAQRNNYQLMAELKIDFHRARFVLLKTSNQREPNSSAVAFTAFIINFNLFKRKRNNFPRCFHSHLINDKN